MQDDALSHPDHLHLIFDPQHAPSTASSECEFGMKMGKFFRTRDPEALPAGVRIAAEAVDK